MFDYCSELFQPVAALYSLYRETLRFQLLAYYFEQRGDFNLFAQVVAESVVCEWDFKYRGAPEVRQRCKVPE